MLPFSVVLLQQIIVTQQELLHYYGNAIKLIVTQHELLRYYGNAIYSVLHNRSCYVTMEMQYGA
jgi:hypothetical protein